MIGKTRVTQGRYAEPSATKRNCQGIGQTSAFVIEPRHSEQNPGEQRRGDPQLRRNERLRCQCQRKCQRLDDQQLLRNTDAAKSATTAERTVTYKWDEIPRAQHLTARCAPRSTEGDRLATLPAVGRSAKKAADCGTADRKDPTSRVDRPHHNYFRCSSRTKAAIHT